MRYLYNNYLLQFVMQQNLHQSFIENCDVILFNNNFLQFVIPLYLLNYTQRKKWKEFKDRVDLLVRVKWSSKIRQNHTLGDVIPLPITHLFYIKSCLNVIYTKDANKFLRSSSKVPPKSLRSSSEVPPKFLRSSSEVPPWWQTSPMNMSALTRYGRTQWRRCWIQ